MKKIILLGSMFCLLACSAANADSFSLSIGEPEPAYVEAPYYASPYPIYPTYAVQGAGYRGWHDGRGHRGGGRGGRHR